MAGRRTTLPKAFRIVPCNRCGLDFQSTGPNSKRCDPCKIEHKREYERTNLRARRDRPSACLNCQKPFPPDVHAHTKYCEPCAPIVRAAGAVARYAADPVKHREYGNRHYQKERSTILERRKNPDWLRKAAERLRHRREDPGYRLHCNVSRLICMSLHGEKAGRSWESLVGYTIDHLRQHLERQFLKGMTWANYGPVWHVDHIQPRASFIFASAEDPDFRACWALSNLQPLWAEDNRLKRDKRLHLL